MVTSISVTSFLIFVNEFFTFFIVFPLIIILGIYLTIKLKFIQLFKLKLSFSSLLKKEKNGQGNISHYEAISAVLAGNFGTGNISGMAVALTTGGPGALVWMWVMAFLGAAIQYASCVLGVKYRQKNAENEFFGGPMYYLKDGLGLKKLGLVFSLFTLFGALTVGNFAQVNSVILPLKTLGINPLFGSSVIALLVGLVILGGIQRISKFASFIVPIKAILYLGTALVIISMHSEKIIPSFLLMFKSAFSFSSFGGGVLGIGVLKAMTTGFGRGIFATDAGIGTAPILQASARTKHPVMDGVATLVAPFLVMIVCTSTGLVLMVTGAWQQLDLQSTNMVTYAFRSGLGNDIGTYVVIIALIIFAYTTILAWCFCGEKAAAFLWGERKSRWFRYFYIAMIPVGAIIHVDLVWVLADISISLMLLINLIGIAGLSREVIKDSLNFFETEFKPALKSEQ